MFLLSSSFSVPCSLVYLPLSLHHSLLCWFSNWLSCRLSLSLRLSVPLFRSLSLSVHLALCLSLSASPSFHSLSGSFSPRLCQSLSRSVFFCYSSSVSLLKVCFDILQCLLPRPLADRCFLWLQVVPESNGMVLTTRSFGQTYVEGKWIVLTPHPLGSH